MSLKLNRRHALALATAAACPSLHAQIPAQARLVVGFQAGGTGDFIARTLADTLRAKGFAQSVIVENRAGAGGVLSVQTVKAATPDGTTLLSTPATVLTVLPHTHRKPPFDVFKDLTPLGAVSTLDMALVTSSRSGARTVKEALDAARRDPSLAPYATAGVGTMAHVLGAQITRRSGVPLVHTPYRGGGQALQELIGDQVPLAIVSISDLLLRAQREGRVRILATSGLRRTRFLPDVPTLVESGFEGVVASDWSVIMGPPGMTPERIERVAAAVTEAATQPAYAKALDRFFVEALAMPREAVMKRLHDEYQAMGRIVQQERITVES